MPTKTIAFGNQNCGKTTLFNALTGSNQHVGNFQNVTVEQKSGTIKKHPSLISCCQEYIH
ncbi:MAG: FeoB small GTPase domain-containing protein [Streptococcus sp.]